MYNTYFWYTFIVKLLHVSVPRAQSSGRTIMQLIKIRYCYKTVQYGSNSTCELSSIINKMKHYTSYLFLWNAQNVSGGSSAYLHELKNCIYSIEYFVKPFLLPATVVEEIEFHRLHDSGR